MGKTSCKAKTPLGEFKVITHKNPLINNQAITSMRNLTTTILLPNKITNLPLLSIHLFNLKCSNKNT